MQFSTTFKTNIFCFKQQFRIKQILFYYLFNSTKKKINRIVSLQNYIHLP